MVAEDRPDRRGRWAERLARLSVLAVLALEGCFMGPTGAESTPSKAQDAVAYRFRRPARTLVLGEVSRGNTTSPDARTSSTCKSGGRAGQALDHLYGFEVKETASYRFELSPQFAGVIQVQEKDAQQAWYNGIGCAGARPGGKAVVSVAMRPGFYWVVVDGDLWDEAGPYTLRVDVDRSSQAALQPESAEKMAPLCKDAPELRLGERAFGTYFSMQGGARASCGRVGGDVVRRIPLPTKMRLRLRVAAHFAPAVEIRNSCQGAAVSCVRAPEGLHDVEVVQELEAGEHFIVLDATTIPPRDPYDGRREGAGVAGAFIMDVEEVAR